MGFLDFMFKTKVELPEEKPMYSIEEKPILAGFDPVYSDKGITKRVSKKSGDRWIAQVSIRMIEGKVISVHIGTYDSKLEAQEARYKFIEDLK